MADIETRDESYALQAASIGIEAEFHQELDPEATSYALRNAIRAAWIAGRDWQRQQETDAVAADDERTAEYRHQQERHETALHPERNPHSIFYGGAE